MPVMHEGSKSPWAAQRTLESLAGVNEQCIALLADLAASGRTQAPFGLVEPLRALLLAIDAPSRRRAAQTPHLLLDVQFRNVGWWHEVITRPERIKADTRSSPPHRTRLAALTRATLMLAWHGARAEREAAQVIMGIAPAVLDLIAGLSPVDLNRISERHYRQLAPRWPDRPATWRRLLNGARTGDATALRHFALHGVQLLGADALPHAS